MLQYTETPNSDCEGLYIDSLSPKLCASQPRHFFGSSVRESEAASFTSYASLNRVSPISDQSVGLCRCSSVAIKTLPQSNPKLQTPTPKHEAENPEHSPPDSLGLFVTSCVRELAAGLLFKQLAVANSTIYLNSCGDCCYVHDRG